jgi:hypothetical protein
MDVRQDRSHDAFCDTILQPQQIIGLAVVGVPPNMKIGRRVKQAHYDAHAFAGLGDPSSHDVTGPEISRDQLRIRRSRTR